MMGSCGCEAHWSPVGVCNTNPCTPSPCQNSGTCSLYGSDHRCQCSSGYTGEFLWTPPPLFAAAAAAAAYHFLHPFTLAAGAGTNCETEICASSPCNNGGACSLCWDCLFACGID